MEEIPVGKRKDSEFGTERVLDTSSHSSLFEGASAPPYELISNGSIAEKRGSGKNGNNSVSDLLDQQPPPHLNASNTLLTSEQEIKDAFLQYTATKFCYRTAPAKHLKVQELTPLNTYRYRLETFTESRDTHLASECYYGGFVDSAEVAPVSTLWEISVDPPPLFTDCEMHIPVPHSYFLGNCQNCKGRGTITCKSCEGKGTKKCSACSGTGFNSDSSPCSWCLGAGTKRCFSCRGNGRNMCYRCDMKGILLYHTELSITWENNILEYTADNKSEFPIYHLQEVTGRKILSDEHNLVRPLIDFPESSIKDYSRASIAQHKMMFASGEHRILKQKQMVELVPLTKVKYEWKGKPYSFYVFGNENKVYSKDYPAKYCCSIL